MMADQIRRAIPATPRVRLPSWRRPCGRATPAGRCPRRTRSSSPTRSTPGRPSRRRLRAPGSPWARGRGRPATWSAAAAGRARAGSRRSSRPASRWPRPRSCRRSPPRWRAAASAGSPSAISRFWRGSAARPCRTAVRQAVALGILTSEEWRLTAWRSAPNTVRIVARSGAPGSGCATGSGQGPTTRGRQSRGSPSKVERNNLTAIAVVLRALAVL